MSIANIRTEGVSETTLYNTSAIVSLTDRTAVFGSWMTGLEESGVAPTLAINRDDVAGQLGTNTSVVLGAVAFEPEVTGPLADAGVSNVVANANIERQLWDDWSVDAGLSYSSERWADTANTFKTPATTTVSIGARHKFEVAGRPAEFRVLASNLTGVEGYWATPSGLLSPIPSCTVRAMLTVTFGPKG